MQPASEKCSYLEEFSCKEDSLKDNNFCFDQNQASDTHAYLINIIFRVVLVKP